MVFGGSPDGSSRLSRIAAYAPSTNEWTTDGNLKEGRFHHGVINVGDEYLVIGGWDTGQRRSEKCHYTHDQLECTYQNPTEPVGE